MNRTEVRWKIAFLLALALALGHIGYSLIIGAGGGSKLAHMQVELQRIEEENQTMKGENRRLALEVEALKRRRDYLEKVARDELGLLKDDEMVFHVPTIGRVAEQDEKEIRPNPRLNGGTRSSARKSGAQSSNRVDGQTTGGP